MSLFTQYHFRKHSILEKCYIEELKDINIHSLAYKANDDEALIVIENDHYSTHTQAGRVLRILSKHVPLKFTKLSIIFSKRITNKKIFFEGMIYQ